MIYDGSLIIGIILTARPIIRMGYKEWRKRSNIIDYGHIIPTPKEIEADRQSNEDDKAFIFGIFMTVIGTLILTFAELISGLLI